MRVFITSGRACLTESEAHYADESDNVVRACSSNSTLITRAGGLAGAISCTARIPATKMRLSCLRF